MKRLTNRRPNPIAARVAPPVGQALPSDWSQQAVNHGGTFDRRNWAEVFNAPQWSAKTNSATTENIIQSARLSK